MNRRELLLLLATVACGTPKTPVRRRRNPNGREGSDTVIVDDWSARNASQLAPSPLAIRGELVAFATPEELLFIDATTLKQVDHIQEQYRSICVLPGGALLGFSKSTGGRCTLDLIKGTVLERSLDGRECVLMDGARLYAISDSELYVAREGVVVRYRIAGDHLNEVARFTLDGRAKREVNGEDQSVVTPDGRLIVPIGRSLHVYQLDKPPVVFRGAPRSIAHVALASRDRVWYSRWNGEGRIDVLTLAQLADGLPADVSISLAPDRITHMASDGLGGLAMLLVNEKAQSGFYTLVRLGDDGRERWRTTIDKDILDTNGVNLNLAFVAVTSTRVVLAAAAQLYAWDETTGTRMR